jgi:hypothetical protein
VDRPFPVAQLAVDAGLGHLGQRTGVRGIRQAVGRRLATDRSPGALGQLEDSVERCQQAFEGVRDPSVRSDERDGRPN